MGRFDLSFKSLTDGKTLTMLRLFGRTPIDAATRVTPVERELAMGIKSVDHAYLIERNGERYIEHFEAQLRLSAEVWETILQRAVLMAIAKQVPVWTTVVLLSRRERPVDLHGAVRSRRGCVSLSMRPRVIKLWEMEGRRILEGGDIKALPLSGAMKTTREEMDRAIEQLRAVRNRELRSNLAAEMVTWCSLQYNEEEIADLRARLDMVTAKEVWEASPIGEEIREYGRQEGRQEGLQRGLQEGQLIEARANLRILIESRFPKLLSKSAIESIGDLSAIHRLFRSVAASADLTEARAAVKQTLGSRKGS